jgi:hypothetical protein
MDVEKVLECLNQALELQHRSILQFNRRSSTRPARAWRRSPRCAATPRPKVAKVSSDSDPAKVIDGWLRRARREP